jgi:hypothetical protein
VSEPKQRAFYRDVNEQIRLALLRFSHDGAEPQIMMSLVCECQRSGCVEMISVTVGDYEAVQATPGLYVVRRGHQDGNGDRLVREDRGFDVVQQHG